MKKVIFIAMLFISTISFGQSDEKFVNFPGDAKAPSKPEWTIPPTDQAIELDRLARDFEDGGELNRSVRLYWR